MIIIDNFLDKDLIKFFNKICVHQIPHFYGHNSHEKSNPFYKSNINLDDTLIRFICEKLKKQLNFKSVLRAYINVQFKDMDGDWHDDDGTNTILLMVTKTLPKNSGCFEIKKDNKIEKVDFVQNRLISFDARLKHRGLAPKEPNTPRVTFALKTE